MPTKIKRLIEKQRSSVMNLLFKGFPKVNNCALSNATKGDITYKINKNEGLRFKEHFMQAGHHHNREYF